MNEDYQPCETDCVRRQSDPDWWTDAWLYVDSATGQWWHFWPDNTTFGPFQTREEAVDDCKRRAQDYDP